MNADLQQFVREALARGMAREQIKSTLAAARWRTEEIDAALAAWADGEAGLPVPRRRVSLSAREAFMHLVLFATLYIFTFDAGAILFAIIERRLRDVAVDFGGADLAVLRWTCSGLVTALPIFLWTNTLVERSLAREPEKRSSGVRRWLTYLTLFVAALVLIGNFSTIVSGVLSGEMTMRFFLKCVVVFAIAGTVFGHYLSGLRREEAEAEIRGRRTSWLGRAGVIAAALVALAGLFELGSPARSRTRHLDARRIDDLLALQQQIDEYYRNRQVLPVSPESLSAHGYRANALRDPVSGAAYGYEVVDSVTYRLSATFATDDTLRADGRPVDLAWRHGTGRHVFTRQAPVSPDTPPRPTAR